MWGSQIAGSSRDRGSRILRVRVAKKSGVVGLFGPGGFRQEGMRSLAFLKKAARSHGE
jgi:hypothetical protein